MKGVKISDLKKNIDERGFFCELLREDWKDILEGDNIAQVNLSMSLSGVVRAWHRHLKGQNDYVTVIKGKVKICVFDGGTGRMEEFILRGDDLKILKIDGKYWHGTKNIGDEPALTLYLVTKLYDYKDPDEERMAPNSKKVIDPRNQRPYEW